jgi:hypothetical protein
MTTLHALAARFEAMNEAAVVAVVRDEMAKAARPFAPAVRAAILNIPTTGTKHTGLRLRIAGCVQTWAEIKGPLVSVGVEINAARMPDGEKALPLYMEGVKAPWLHPLFGNRERWYFQPAHPYFYEAMTLFGPASQHAVDRAVDKIAAAIDH